MFAYLLFVPISQAKTHQQSFSIPLTKTNWSNSIVLNTLPTNSGSLSSIQFTLFSEIVGTLKVESLDSATGTIVSNLGAEIEVQRPNTSVLHTHTPSARKTDVFGPYDGTVDYAGTSGNTHAITSSSTGTTTMSTLTGSDLALFQGNGTVTLPVTAVGVSSFSGNGNLQSESTLNASALITVQYNYKTPDLQISKIANSSFVVGNQGTFTFQVNNVGSGATFSTTSVTDSLPSGLQYVSATGSGWLCTATGQLLTCTNTGTLLSGASFSDITLTVGVNSNAVPSVTNTAIVRTLGDINENGGANSSSVTVNVQIPTTNSPSGGSGGGGGGSGGGGGRGTGGTPTSRQAAYGGPIAKDSTEAIDAQGCPVPEKHLHPTDLDNVDICFELVPERAITFIDTENHPQRNSIETLKQTRIITTGDFIVSGHGNHSSGKQQAHFQAGEFFFEPNRGLSRLEITKIALISNCIPIEDNPFDVDIRFSDIAAQRSENELDDFIARVFYTAAKHGIVTGYQNGKANPLEKATNAEIIAILLRASKVMPQGFVSSTGGNWHAPYMEVARANMLVQASVQPQQYMLRGDVSKLILDVMALHADPKISGYIARLYPKEQKKIPRELLYTPLVQVGNLVPDATKECADRSTTINSCFTYDSRREVEFSDVQASTPYEPFIDLLKKTRIIATGDYIFSGTGNHSTGKQQAEYQAGQWEFQPLRNATRLEVVKTALVANCIPILDYIPRTGVEFTDVPTTLSPDDDVADFVSRVFYTAALHGIVTGYADGTARPQEFATATETIAILLRTANAVPKDYTPTSHPAAQSDFLDQWYAPFISFAVHNHIVTTDRTRNLHSRNVPRYELTRMLTQIMQMSTDLRVRSYRNAIDPRLR